MEDKVDVLSKTKFVVCKYFEFGQGQNFVVCLNPYAFKLIKLKMVKIHKLRFGKKSFSKNPNEPDNVDSTTSDSRVLDLHCPQKVTNSRLSV